MDDDGIEANSYKQLIQSVWTESCACMYTLYWNVVYWRDFLSKPVPTDQLICLNSGAYSKLFHHLWYLAVAQERDYAAMKVL